MCLCTQLYVVEKGSRYVSFIYMICQMKMEKNLPALNSVKGKVVVFLQKNKHS